MVKGSRTMFHRQYIGLLAIVLISPGLAHARKPGDPLKPGHNFYSPQQDIQIGRIQAAQVKMHYPVVPNEFLQAYIRRVGQRLAATPEAVRSEFPFEFTLLNVPAVNAFALPGGPMFIFTGLVKSTASEAQLAGVMAHEMSHVILRHGTHELTKKQTTGLATGLAAALGTAALGNQAGLAQLTRMGMDLGENSLILHFSREKCRIREFSPKPIPILVSCARPAWLPSAAVPRAAAKPAARPVVCFLVRSWVPWRRITWDISCAITPANWASLAVLFSRPVKM